MGGGCHRSLRGRFGFLDCIGIGGGFDAKLSRGPHQNPILTITRSRHFDRWIARFGEDRLGFVDRGVKALLQRRIQLSVFLSVYETLEIGFALYALAEL